MPAFEIKVWTTDQGSSPWYNGTGGRIPQNRPLWGMEESGAVHVTVRAQWLPSKIVPFAGAEREAAAGGQGQDHARRGREVQLRFNLPKACTGQKAICLMCTSKISRATSG